MATRDSGYEVPCAVCGQSFWIRDGDFDAECPPVCDTCIADLDDSALPWGDDIEGHYLVEVYAPPACDVTPEFYDATPAPADLEF